MLISNIFLSTTLLIAASYGKDCKSTNFDAQFGFGGDFSMSIDGDVSDCGSDSSSEAVVELGSSSDIDPIKDDATTVTQGMYMPTTVTPLVQKAPTNLHGDYKYAIEGYQNDLESKGASNKPDFKEQYQKSVTMNEDYANDYAEGSDPTDLPDQFGVEIDFTDEEDWEMAQIFSKVMLPLKYDMLEPSSFIRNDDKRLANQIEHSFDIAFKKSGLAAFGKGMNAIRPHIAYAIAISWNVQHYAVDIEKLYAKEDNVDTVEGIALRDDEFNKDDGSKIINSMGRYAKLGDRSEVSDTLREVEQNFENFVVEIQIWAINSIGQIYKVVKNMQKAMKKGNQALKYYQQTRVIPKTAAKLRVYNQKMGALLHFRTEMNHYLAKIPDTLAEMVAGVEKMMRILMNNMMKKIQDANKQTKMEQEVASRTDEEAKYGNTTLTKNIVRTNDYLDRVKKQIIKSEKDLANNVNNTKKYIDRKLKRQNKFLLSIQNLQTKKLEAWDKYKKELDLYKQRMGLLLGEMESRRKPIGTCNSEMFKACFRQLSSTSQAEACFTHAVQHHSLNPECLLAQKDFEAKVNYYKDMQQKYLAVLEKKKKVVNDILAEIDEEKRMKEHVLQEDVEFIDRLKNEKILKRKKLLVLKENQLKGERYARVIKGDLENSMEEFKSVSDTLTLTQLALKEVFDAMNSNLVNLNKFRVQLITMKGDILGQVDKFKDMKRRMVRVAGSGEEKIIGNPLIFRTELKEVYTDSMRAGVGMVVMSRMYDSIFSFMMNLEDCPVGLYKPNLSVTQNVQRFQKFIKKMTKQRDWGLDDEDEEIEENKKQQESLDRKCAKEGIECANEEVETFQTE